MTQGLLAPYETPAVVTEREFGRGPLVIACEHASNAFPRSVDRLGLSAADRQSHYAWDPGALLLARRLSDIFDAPLVAARYSRLVFDVNRAPGAEHAIRSRLEDQDIPGNIGLSPSERAMRAEELHRPFRQALGAALDRALARAPVALATVHSFTRRYEGRERAVELGLLHDADARLVDAMLPFAEAETGLKSARNEPYGPADGVTHTLVVDALPRGVPNVMLELRNDLLEDPARVDEIALRLAALLRIGLAELAEASPAHVSGAARREV